MIVSIRRLSLIALNLALAFAVISVWATPNPVPVSDPNVSISKNFNFASEAKDLDLLGTNDARLFGKRTFNQVVHIDPGPQPVTPLPLNFRLAGVVWSNSEKIAIMQRSENGEHQRLRVGDEIDGWKLRSLSERSASVESNSNIIELRLAANNLH